MHIVMNEIYSNSNFCQEKNSQIVTDSKKDDCTELANITMPTNPRQTGNLKKF